MAPRRIRRLDLGLKIGAEMSYLTAGFCCSNSVSEERYCKKIGSWEKGFHFGEFWGLGLGFCGGDDDDDCSFHVDDASHGRE